MPSTGHGDSALGSPIWQQENVTLLSVGIDIGSSGTQVVFSRIRMARNGEGLATRFVVIERSCLFESAVTFTPFTESGLIDGPALGAIIDEAYAAARVRPESVDTGVAILTGEALHRENARRVAATVSTRAGDFVCATAGHHMEATLAAFGSGAARRSADTGQRILNVDIGGGTTKLSLLVDGKVTSTAALHVGGRLLVTDPAGRVVRLEAVARDYARSVGIALDLGDSASSDELDAITSAMVASLVAALSPDLGASPEPLPWLTDPIGDLGDVDGIVCSGGVAEYVYGIEDRDFGDLGRRLGRSIRARLCDRHIPLPLLPAAARIRATALGASQFSVQLSGSTCYLPDAAELLPLRNVPVVHPTCGLGDDVDVVSLTESMRRHLASFDASEPSSGDLVLALTWSGELSYDRLHALGRAVVGTLAQRIAAGRPVLLAVDADLGRSLGAMLRHELGVSTGLLVVDGLDLLDFDFIDIGRPLQPSNVVPVTIKSLVFPAFDRPAPPGRSAGHHPAPARQGPHAVDGVVE